MTESTTKSRQDEARQKNQENFDEYSEVVDAAKENRGTIVLGNGTTAHHFRANGEYELGDTLSASLTRFYHVERSRLGEVEYMLRWEVMDEEATKRTERFAEKQGKDIGDMYENGLLPSGVTERESFNSYAAAIRKFGEVIPDSAEAKHRNEL